MNTEWIEIPFAKELEYNHVFDNCTCPDPDNIYYSHSNGKYFCVMCVNCQTTVAEKDMVTAMVVWNRGHRNIL